MKKIIKMFCCFVVLLVITISNLSVNAARIVIERDDNPSDAVVYSIGEENYYIEVDDEKKIGHVINCEDNLIIELGTCKVTVIDYDNKDAYVLCNDTKENSLGEIVITISNDISIITYINGEIETIMELYTTVIIED